MKTLYLDCFSGIAGDMFLGAVLDLGLDAEEFKRKLASLNFDGYTVNIERTTRGGFTGTNVTVELDGDDHGHHHHHDEEHDHHHDHEAHTHEHTHTDGVTHTHEPVHDGGHVHTSDHAHQHVHRGLKEIDEIISNSSLSPRTKERSLRAFRLLAEAEGSIHGLPPEQVHFHEVGAIDSIVDIVGAFILVEMLDVDRVCASPVNVGSGTVMCAHGLLPVPAPATARLLEGIPVFSNGQPMERTTPTGALLLQVLCDSFGPVPAGVIKATGYGFGDRESDLPNMLRATLIEEGTTARLPYSTGMVTVMETNIDDMNPQDYQDLEERLFAAGALDVFFTPIFMKKMRPAVRLTCIVLEDKREAVGEVILRYSSSIGVRWSESRRMTLRRQIVSFESSLGHVNIKQSRWGDEVVRITPEYDDLRRISATTGMALNDLRTRVLAEFMTQSEADHE